MGPQTQRMLRDDLSGSLVHLTKGKTHEDAALNFMSIVDSRVLRGGRGFIRDAFQCVCFTEAPISKLAFVLAVPSIHGMPYAPLGVIVDKSTAFTAGGRPVIYQPESEYADLPAPIRYRHKRFEPESGIDFTWEREWRIRTTSFPLDPAHVTLVVPTREWSDYFFQRHAYNSQGDVQAGGEAGYMYVDKCPWHFIVLEDLGIKVPFSHVPSF